MPADVDFQTTLSASASLVRKMPPPAVPTQSRQSPGTQRRPIRSAVTRPDTGSARVLKNTYASECNGVAVVGPIERHSVSSSSADLAPNACILGTLVGNASFDSRAPRACSIRIAWRGKARAA
jgi:hypothetical protein